jgi:23S rRNA pseudouridine2605 synthase
MLLVMRLLTYLQQTNGIARRKLVQFIDQGKIFLNNQKVESYTAEIQEGDTIRILGRNDEAKPSTIKHSESLLLFNKPKGYVVAKSDPHEQTIYKILPYEYQKWYYIGRLDKESHGLLLLTDNPQIVNEYEHPSHGIQKEYIVELDRQL